MAVPETDNYEWCVNAPAVDKNGTVYADSEDGNLYVINQGRAESNIFLQSAVGAAYNPYHSVGTARSTRKITATCSLWGLRPGNKFTQLGVLGFGLLQDWNVGVGVFPQIEKLLIDAAFAFALSRRALSTPQLQVRQGPERKIEHNSAMVEKLLEFSRGLRSLPCAFADRFTV